MVGLLCCLLCTSQSAPFEGDKLPKPNRENPVDYVAWLHERFAAGSGPNAYGEYVRAVTLLDDAEATEPGPPRLHP